MGQDRKANHSSSGLPHENMPASPHAVILISGTANTHADPHADKLAPRHVAHAHVIARQHARLRACPHSQLSHNPTSQQESMRT